MVSIGNGIIQPGKSMRESNNLHKGVEMFSDLMTMKFTPSGLEGSKQLKERASLRQKVSQRGLDVRDLLNKIHFVKNASRESVIVGNQDQLDMVNLDGLCHNYVDTFHQWSLNLGKAIDHVKLNRKRQVMLVITERTLLLYRYVPAKRQRSKPLLLATLPLQDQVRFVQWASTDNIAIFYKEHFEIYYFTECGDLQQRLHKKYDVAPDMKLLAVPQAIDHILNVFFEGAGEGKTFELRCIEIGMQEENIHIGEHYKIYDIMKRMKQILVVQNFSRDIILLYLGQEILVARRGYIVDSVTISLQSSYSCLKYLPEQQLLVHVEPTTIELYHFGVNTNAVPNRIQLTSLDSIQLKHPGPEWKLLKLLPILDNNYVVFYQKAPPSSNPTGELQYSFAMSYTVGMSEKVDRLLENKHTGAGEEQEEVEAKADILRKMGMKDRQIYLQLWQKSSQSTLQDYQLLLSTNHYPTIKQQIENKMRKQSMNFKEVYRIEEACLLMMQPRVLSEQCTEELLRDYLSCFLLLRKFKLFKELSFLREGEELIGDKKPLLMNIQDAYSYKKKEVRQFLLQPIAKGQYRSGMEIQSLRVILNHFRLIFRYIYPQLMRDIAAIAKQDLLTLLKALPELLPVDKSEVRVGEGSQKILYEGVWGDIPESQWQKSMFLGKIQNIYNQQITNDFVKSLWFKRNWLTAHNLIPLSQKQLTHTAHNNCNSHVFYLIISTIYHTIPDPNVFHSTLQHIQSHYSTFPKHLYGKVPLYLKLHHYYQRTRSSNQSGPCLSLEQFLRLEDHLLMREMFQLQKARKNCLLSQVKGIYQAVLRGQSCRAFNESILSYFRWEGSRVSDLKYLLNRINNQKREFHDENSDMYAILVEATMIKLRIGSPSDVPIDEVLIYLENLPIRRHNQGQAVEQLQLIQKISEESDSLRKMRLNMTIRQIADQPHTVITQLVEYHLNKYDISHLHESNAFISRTYRLLAEIQSLKEKLYGQNYNELTLFLYVTRLLQYEDKVSLVKLILEDEHLNSYFFIDIAIIESIVIYNWKWKLSKCRAYLKAEQYLLKLLELLPSNNSLRQYLSAQATYALILTTPSRPISYPLSPHSVPNTSETTNIITSLPASSLPQLPIATILECLDVMVQLHSVIEDKSSVIGAGPGMVPTSSAVPQKIDAKAVYQGYLGALAHHGLVREAVSVLREWYSINESADGLGCLLVVHRMFADLNSASKISLGRICSHLYNQPGRLVQLLEEFLQQKVTGRQAIRILREQYQSLRTQFPNFSVTSNPVFSSAFEQVVKNHPNSFETHNQLVKNTLVKLKRSRGTFLHNYTLDLIYALLCHNPYQIPIFLKYIGEVAWKELRLFLVQLINQPLFDRFSLLQMSRRTFFTVLRSYRQSLDIHRLSQQYRLVSIYQTITPYPMGDLPLYEQKIMNNLEVFTRLQPSHNSFPSSFFRQKTSSIEQEQAITDSLNQIQSHDPSTKQVAVPPQQEDSKQEQAMLNPLYRPPPPSILSSLPFDPDAERHIFIKRDSDQKVYQRRRQLGEERLSVPRSPLPSGNTSDVFQGVLGEAKKKKEAHRIYFSKDVRSQADDNQSPQNSLQQSHSLQDRSISGAHSLDEPQVVRPHLRIHTKKSNPHLHSNPMLGEDLPQAPIKPFRS